MTAEAVVVAPPVADLSADKLCAVLVEVVEAIASIGHA